MSDPKAYGYTPERPYPHVVIRYIAAIYGRIPVVFGHSGPPLPRTICVPDPEPLPGEPLPEQARRHLVERTLEVVMRCGLRCCVVFGPGDAVFCERDGTASSSAEPPSGGVRIDRMQNTPTGDDAPEGESGSRRNRPC